MGNVLLSASPQGIGTAMTEHWCEVLYYRPHPTCINERHNVLECSWVVVVGDGVVMVVGNRGGGGCGEQGW